MNKPAAKEPSMDEILSSIRQIIADDDAAVTPETADTVDTDSSEDAGFPSFDAFLADEAPESVEEPEPEPEPEPETAAGEDDIEALALSLDQVIDEAGAMDPSEMGHDEDLPSLSDMAGEEGSGLASQDDIAFMADDVEAPAPVAEEPFAAPNLGTMPDASLSDDIAGQLLDSTAEAAASHAFAKLGALSLGAGSQTIEGVVKELLRPMLKAWLDENLPSIVERLVEREIERVSRGGRQ